MSPSISLRALLFLSVTAAATAASGAEFAAGHLFVTSEGNGKIVEFDRKGHVVGPFLPLGASAARDVAFDPAGWMWVADVGRLVAFDASGAKRAEAAGFTGLVGVAIGPGGKVYASDVTFDVVRVFDRQGNQIGTLGQPSPLLIDPDELDFDAEGRLFAVAPGAFRLVAFDLKDAVVRNSAIFAAVPGRSCRLGATRLVVAGAFVRFFDAQLMEIGELASNVPVEVGQCSDLVTGPNAAVYFGSTSNDRVIRVRGFPFAVPENGIKAFDATPELQSPRGMALAPWRYRVRVKGKLIVAGSIANVRSISRKATLSVFPGGSVAMLAFDGAPELALVAGASVAVFHGMEVSVGGGDSQFHGTERPKEAGPEALGSLAFQLHVTAGGDGTAKEVEPMKGSLELASRYGSFFGSLTVLDPIN